MRYFPIVGRAQALRHALLDTGLRFDDVQLDLMAWHGGTLERGLGGRYHGLPVLVWNDAVISETLPIASFLARELGEYDGLSSVEIARREAISSNCYLELIIRLGELIWCDAMYPGADRHAGLKVIGPRMLQKLGGVEAQLESPWLCGEAPGIADHFAAEALELLRRVLGPAREPALRARFTRLFAHRERLMARPRLRSADAQRPIVFTGRPDEPEVLASLASADFGF